MTAALSGALAQARRVDKVANNLANVDTPGYKADGLLFEEAVQGAHRQDLRADMPDRPLSEQELFSRVGSENRVVLTASEYTDLKAGSYRQTGNSLDVAIEGNGFLEVLTPSGIRLSRAGNLSLDAGGRLVTKDGFLVLGRGNAAQPPAMRAITVGSSAVTIDHEGNILAGSDRANAPLGTLSLVQVDNPAALKKVGMNMFEAPTEALRPEGPARGPAGEAVLNPGSAPRPNPLGSAVVRPKIHQGMLEGSNVNAISEMSQMIEAHRSFEQNTKLLQNLGDLNARVSEVGKF